MKLRSVLPKTHSVLLKPRNTNETSLRIAESLLVIHESSLSFHESSLRMVEEPSLCIKMNPLQSVVLLNPRSLIKRNLQSVVFMNPQAGFLNLRSVFKYRQATLLIPSLRSCILKDKDMHFS